MGAIAEIAVLDIVLGNAGAVDGVLDGMRGQRHRRGDVESAAAGLGQTRAGIGNDYGFTHFSLPLAGRLRLISYEFLTRGNKNTARGHASRAESCRPKTQRPPSGISGDGTAPTIPHGETVRRCGPGSTPSAPTSLR